MSSLLQHKGKIVAGKVELFMYLVRKWPNSKLEDVEEVVLQRPNGTITRVPKLYRIWRKPAGTLGQWVVFRYNGEEHVPDLSIPIPVTKLPRDAKPLTKDEMTEYWFTP